MTDDKEANKSKDILAEPQQPLRAIYKGSQSTAQLKVLNFPHNPEISIQEQNTTEMTNRKLQLKSSMSISSINPQNKSTKTFNNSRLFKIKKKESKTVNSS